MKKERDPGVARALQARMAERNINQVDLAEAAGVSRPTLAWLVNDGIGHLETLKRVCRELNIPISDILKRAELIRDELRDDAATEVAP